MLKVRHSQHKYAIIKYRKIISQIVLFAILFLVVITLTGCTSITDLIFAGTDPTTLSVKEISQQILDMVWRVDKWVLGAGGIVGTIYFILSGYFYMTAFGDKEKIEKAKKGMLMSILGVVILAACLGIVTFVFNKVLDLKSDSQINSPSWFETYKP